MTEGRIAHCALGHKSKPREQMVDKDIVPSLPHAAGRATILPIREMSIDELKKIFNSIPW